MFLASTVRMEMQFESNNRNIFKRRFPMQAVECSSRGMSSSLTGTASRYLSNRWVLWTLVLHASVIACADYHWLNAQVKISTRRRQYKLFLIMKTLPMTMLLDNVNDHGVRQGCVCCCILLTWYTTSVDASKCWHVSVHLTHILHC